MPRRRWWTALTDLNSVDWYALHVRTGCEPDVVQEITADGLIRALLPKERTRDRRGRLRERVLMPGYVFAGCHMDADLWQRIRHARHVLDVLGEPFVPITSMEMDSVMALYWHGINGTRARRVQGVTEITEGPLCYVPHEVVRADARVGLLIVRLALPGGQRDICVHADFD